MNLQHIKYAVEIAETGSINKAAEKLIIGQPSLSRALKELEASLNIKIFDRSAKGMTLTAEGETFMIYAKSILMQVDSLEETFTKGIFAKQRFSLVGPRSGYISEAFSRFSLLLENETDVEVFYKETNYAHAVNSVLQNECKLGIIRYAADHDKYYSSTLEEKRLKYEMISELRYSLIMNKECQLAADKNITAEKLAGYTEIAYTDPYVLSVPFADVKRNALSDGVRKKIFVSERASRLEVLAADKNAFMLASPLPTQTLERYGLVQCRYNGSERIYKDVLIYKDDYSLTRLDKLFIEELIRAKRNIIEI